MQSAVGQKTHGFCSCSKVPANVVALVVGWQHEGVLVVEMACRVFRWDAVLLPNFAAAGRFVGDFQVKCGVKGGFQVDLGFV
jgi:hypothetical protein